MSSSYADVFPDSLTRMVSCMVKDEEIIGLCGELNENYEQSTFCVLKLFIKLSFPDTFRVILSQHRRLSTVHNLA
ncbi:uncharacterized protein C8R40DRAFT_1108855 [Lentinula edodes]|uniref:uncharacterized protein n=1 Tax=Lentinula edodes TaxID=5353 RepID=UPI001E8CE828|nr:uncharacterized protein C8R40DRAFT_1108855 [Lentinula edodes]KAH7874429.1 hypothetical protein C8R40DRAFT_1108855 [Lentinula edodes]